MKNLFSLGRTICLTLAAAGCLSCAKEYVQETPEYVKYEINAVYQDGMKTHLEGKDVIWDETDVLCCFSYTDSPVIYSYMGGVAPVTIDGKNARFEITSKSGFIPKILIYPQNENYGLLPDGNVTIPMPETFQAVKDTVPEGSLISIGVIRDGKVVMRNALSFLKLTIESSDICKIRIRTNDSTAISGTLTFDPETMECSAEGNDCIYIVPKDTSIFEPGTYYAPIPASNLPKGLNVKFYKENGEAARKALESSYTVERNKFINMGKESDWNLVFKPATTTVKIVFWYSSGCVFPFSDKPEATTMMTAPKVSDVAGKGRLGPFYPIGYPGVKVYFCVQNTSGSKSYFISQGTYGLRFGGTIGDYMTIPSLEGYRFAGIDLTYGTKTGYYAVTSDPASGATVQLSKFSGKDKTYTKNFTSAETKADTSYRISTTATYETAIRQVIYHYEIID